MRCRYIVFNSWLFLLFSEGQKENNDPFSVASLTSKTPAKPAKRPSIFGSVEAMAETSRTPYCSPVTSSAFFPSPLTPSLYNSSFSLGSTFPMRPIMPYAALHSPLTPSAFHAQHHLSMASPVVKPHMFMKSPDFMMNQLTPPPTPISTMVSKTLSSLPTYTPTMAPSPTPFSVNRLANRSPALPLSPALVPAPAPVQVVNGGYGIKNPFLAITNNIPREKPAQELGMYCRLSLTFNTQSWIWQLSTICIKEYYLKKLTLTNTVVTILQETPLSEHGLSGI